MSTATYPHFADPEAASGAPGLALDVEPRLPALPGDARRDQEFERDALPWIDDVYRFALSLTRHNALRRSPPDRRTRSAGRGRRPGTCPATAGHGAPRRPVA